MTVTLIASLYGTAYDGFVPEWIAALEALNDRPAEIIVGSDRPRDIPGVQVVVSECRWRYPQAWHQNNAARFAEGEWLWIIDIDNLAMPDALEGIDEIDADVWQMGYINTETDVYYVVPQMTGAEFLQLAGNPFTAGSAFRRDIFEEVGGFSDIAFEDWGLWRALARVGATFESSGRAHYRYVRHPDARSETEMGPWNRAEHEQEMFALEA